MDTLAFLVLAAMAGPSDDPAVGESQYRTHIEAIERKVAGEGFTTIVCPPFVVIGDEPADVVRGHAEHTIRWAGRHLKALYFEKDPEGIIDVWLFKDKESYEKHMRALFGREPSTPYGSYLAEERRLVMNIATGGGTLVHELVHAYIHTDFPDCPPWFNEGLASLYEACGEKEGRILGKLNWRLPGLQNDIRQKRLPSFRELLAADEKTFYEGQRRTNYAQSRYLCYFLQEHGLLTRFYREFRQRRREDPSGHETLRRVLGIEKLGDDAMAAFQDLWQDYVLELTRRDPE